MENIKAIRVLLVEDDDEDADILCRYTRKCECLRDHGCLPVYTGRCVTYLFSTVVVDA